jgi:TonB-linked SusC/RagA family outer membrane protein
MRFTIRFTRSIPALVATLLGLALGSSAALAAQEPVGTVEGRVIDRATRAGLAGAQVSIVGTTRSAVTDAEGRFRIGNVPVRAIELRVRFIGYGTVTRAVTVAAGELATVEIELTSSPVALDAVLVTATGEARAREVPNAVSTIQAADVAEKAAPQSFTDLIQARIPGLNVQQSGGTSGTGTRVRIRGSNSVSLSNEPVLIVDGIRVNNDANANSIGVGGQQPSRLNDLNPEDIESIDVIKGPSAAALYGTAGANGVIRVTTRQGRPGQTRWGFYWENTGFGDVGDYPANYRGVNDTVIAGAPTVLTCALRNTSGVASPCPQDRLFAVNPLEDRSPFQHGTRIQYGGNVSGGREGLTYYVSGELEDEEGIYAANGGRKYNMRANLRALVSDRVEITVGTGYLNSSFRLPENDNNSFGILPSGLLGRTDTINGGYGFLTPEQSMSLETRQNVDRFDARAHVTWKPIGWLDLQATVGTDITARLDERTTFPGEIPAAFSITAFEGSRVANRINNYNTSVNFLGRAERRLSESVRSTTSAGLQYVRDYSQGVFASGRKLVAGSNSLGGTVIPTVNETTNETILLGGFVEELVGFRDRVFLTASLRGDRNSAFGRQLESFEIYPKFGASWVISEEPFFPQVAALSSLRLRMAYGQALLQPGTTASLQFFSPVAVSVNNVDVPGITVGNLGNPDLKPERIGEFEIGLDADLYRGRARLEFTYYNKRSRDALIARRLAPSLGVSTTQFDNLGEVSNKGVELMLDVTPVDLPNVRWDLTLSGWGNRNRLIELGAGIEPIVFGLGGASQRHEVGYPLGGFWGNPVGFSDVNGDGVIQTAEVTQSPTLSYLGTPFPTHGGALSTTVTLYKRLRLFANVDGRFGHSLFNSTEEFRCGFGICRGLHDPASSLFDQARSIASGPLGNDAGYMEKADFIKLREVSLTYTLPQAWAARMRASGASLTLAARNLATWTDYTGLDPEISGGGQSNFNSFDFLSQPAARFLTLRVNVTF